MKNISMAEKNQLPHDADFICEENRNLIDLLSESEKFSTCKEDEKARIVRPVNFDESSNKEHSTRHSVGCNEGRSRNGAENYPPLKPTSSSPQTNPFYHSPIANKNEESWEMIELENEQNNLLQNANIDAVLTSNKLHASTSGCNPYDASKQLDPIRCEKYKKYLMKLWEENSLDNSSLDTESSGLPSLSSISEDAFHLEQASALNMDNSDNINDRNEFFSAVNINPSPNKAPINPSEEKFPLNLDTKTQNQDVLVGCRNKSHLWSRIQGPKHETRDILQNTADTNSEAYYKMQSINQNENIFPVQPSNLYTNSSPDPRTSNFHRNYDNEESCDHCRNKERQIHFRDMNRDVRLNTHRNQFRSNAAHDAQGKTILHLRTQFEKVQNRILNLSQEKPSQDNLKHLPPNYQRKLPYQEVIAEESQAGDHFEEMAYPVFHHVCRTSNHASVHPSSAFGHHNAHNPLGRRASCQYPQKSQRQSSRNQFGGVNEPPSDDFVFSNVSGDDHRTLENFRDRIFALQMQNLELSLFLKQEEQRRKEAEKAVRKEKEYIKKLEDNIQNLSTTTLIVDPLTYKQEADKYIAARKKPVRRTHTCGPYHLGWSDLVCDAPPPATVARSDLHSTSCPSSPLNHQERKMSPTSSSFEGSISPIAGSRAIPYFSAAHQSQLSDRNVSPCTVEAQLQNEPNYQGLIDGLSSLNVSSSNS